MSSDTLKARALKSYEKHLSITQPNISKELFYSRLLYKRNWQPLLPVSRDASILDLGSGFGLFLHFLKEQGYTQAQGVDASPGCLRICKELGLNVTAQTVQEFLDENDTQFDCISLNHLLEHMPKEEGLKLLDSVLDHLKEGGKVIIATPNMANPLTVGRARYHDITHDVGFTEESVEFMLSLAGFKNVRVLPIDVYVLPNPLFNLMGRFGAWVLFSSFRFLFLLQGINSTKIFTKNILCIAVK